MLIEERFGVSLPWKDYFKRLKKKFKKGKRGTRKRIEKQEEEEKSIEWMNLKFSRNSSIIFSLETFRH